MLRGAGAGAAAASRRWFGTRSLESARRGTQQLLVRTEEKELKTTGILAGNAGWTRTSASVCREVSLDENRAPSGPGELSVDLRVCSARVQQVASLVLSNEKCRHDPTGLLSQTFGALSQHRIQAQDVSTAVSNARVTLSCIPSEQQVQELASELALLGTKCQYHELVKVCLTPTTLTRCKLNNLVFKVFSESDIHSHHMVVSKMDLADGEKAISMVFPPEELDFVLEKLDEHF